MNIIFNSAVGRFEAQFSMDFQGDYAAAKAAKFKCTGPPDWVWYTVKLDPLNKLRETKPASGLTISEEAFVQYTSLSEMEARNAAARAQFAPIKEKQTKAKKERKKQELKDKIYAAVLIPPKPGSDYDYIGREDLPPMPAQENPYKRPAPPATVCFVCEQPTYFYELPDLCLYCEINA